MVSPLYVKAAVGHLSLQRRRTVSMPNRTSRAIAPPKGLSCNSREPMAIDHGPEGIRVNCICPGWIETAMSQPFLEENPEGREFAGKIAPMGRIGQPEDVAEVALF